MKSCPTCSAEVEDTANFCPHCGHGFGKTNPASPPSSPSLLEDAEPTTIAASPVRDAHQRTRAIGETREPTEMSATPPPPPIPTVLNEGTTEQKLRSVAEDEQKTTVMTGLDTTDTTSLPNFMQTEPMQTDEAPTRVHADPEPVQTSASHSPSERNGDSTMAKTTRVKTPEPISIPKRTGGGPTRWTWLALLATVFTAVAGVAVVRLAETGKTPTPSPSSDSTPTQSQANEEPTETPAPVPIESEKTAEAEEQRVAQPESGEAEDPSPVNTRPIREGEWTLDVESVLQSPEFEGFSEAEIALSLSMMKKAENRTAVMLGPKTLMWTERGNTTRFEVLNYTGSDTSWTVEVRSPKGKTKTLQGIISADSLTLDDPFGPGQKPFTRVVD